MKWREDQFLAIKANPLEDGSEEAEEDILAGVDDLQPFSRLQDRIKTQEYQYNPVNQGRDST
ncbi:MAG: hypothetical protein OIF58_12810 [Cohaesibacter sp.]|nr:hypothetical protein [Cohaesibacter sp.]